MTEYAALCISPTCRPQQPRQAQRRCHLCRECEAHLIDDLKTIATVWPDLDREGAGGRRMTDPVSGSPAQAGVDALLARRETVAALMDTATILMGRIAAEIAEKRSMSARSTDPGDIASWIVRGHVPWLTGHENPEFVTELVVDVNDLAHRMLRACPQSTAAEVDVGIPCMVDDCKGRMYARAGTNDGRAVPLVCRRDHGHTLTPGMYLRLAAAAYQGAS